MGYSHPPLLTHHCSPQPLHSEFPPQHPSLHFLLPGAHHSPSLLPSLQPSSPVNSTPRQFHLQAAPRHLLQPHHHMLSPRSPSPPAASPPYQAQLLLPLLSPSSLPSIADN
ncbi:unnamed protein product [Closterium sp. NIES-54]